MSRRRKDGYIQYLCEPDRDYEVNEVVARIYSEAAEATIARFIQPQPAAGLRRPIRQLRPQWPRIAHVF